MLRYKKHKRQVDGFGTSGVGVMDDTDREVSSFTDRAFRSLCVAEEELLNDVPHLPSPIRGMPLSTKYHLGIFNLSVRKTQPLAQLPTIPRQRGRWAPTFQPLLKYAKDGLIDAKTNNNRLCAPEPRGYKQRSKVSSLIKTFDNIENERPEDSPLHTPLSTSSQTTKLNMEERPICETVEKIDINYESLASINPDDTGLNESHNLHRRTAREVFLESKAEICSPLPGSPCSLGSPLPDQLKKVVKKKDSLRRTTFLHSENSAFKSWSDINKRVIGGDESDSSIPGTPPILRSATPCSPLLSRAVPGLRLRDAGQDVGWASPASTLSSSYDAIQMLRTVPPLPNKKTIKQGKESRDRTIRAPLNTRVQEEDMQVDRPPSKEHPNCATKLTESKSPQKIKHELSTSLEAEPICNSSQPFVKQNKEVEEKVVSPQEEVHSETAEKEENVKVPDKHMPSSGRIKSLIQQIEKEATKDVVPLNLPVNKLNFIELPKDDTPEALPAVLCTTSSNSNPPSISKGLVPPWRRTKHNTTMESKEKSIHINMARKEMVTAQFQENVSLKKDEFSEENPIMSSFNITNLLTPIIRRKNIQEALEENHMMMVTPPPVETITTKDQGQLEVNVYQKRDDYKSRATSLLFNLKDMRKRVKSTYGSAINVRNGYDSHLAADVKVQEDASHTIPLLDTSNLMSERKELSQIPSVQTPSPPREQEMKPYVLGKAPDNYLSLSSPPQIMASTIIHNGEIPTDKVDTIPAMQEEDVDSVCLSPTANHIKKELEYPSLNLYHKEDTDVNVEQKEYTEVVPVCIHTAEEPHSQHEQNIVEAFKLDEPADNLAMPAKNVSESQMESEPSNPEQSSSSQDAGKQWVSESDEDGKKVVKQDYTKDSLQYFAVSNCNMEGSGQSGFLNTEDEKKEEGKEKLSSDKQSAESACIEDLKRPSSATSFKPNLFLIKDNKIKSSPVTKSVRLPLFRSLSVDCLTSRKGEEHSFIMEKEYLRETNSKIGESKNIKTDIASAENMEINNVGKHQDALTTRPASETLKHENIGCNQVKMQKEEEDMELWNKLCCVDAEWRKNKTEDAETVKVNESCNDTDLHGLGGPFFHPVETCVSEVTGPSPECNPLLVHNVSESINDLENGEHMSSPLLDTEITNYSPLDNGLLQFEDAMSYSERIPCSTIDSPMPESTTCSIVASPMSVNTQSSGFATALSALDDMPSPPSTGANSSNGKFQFPEKVISTHPSNMELKNSDCTKYLQKKSPTIESQKVHAAKPPTVPPKTEKALRRAKRLTKKRRKTDIPHKTQDGDFQECDFVLDVPSPANVIPTIIKPQSHHKVASSIPRGLQQEESISESSTPSLPNTQRKLLQDPDSGQYFVVDIPVYLRIKTFYDPETGKYLQMSLPPSERGTPALDMSSPYMLYPGLTPVPVSSIESFKGASQLLTEGNLDLAERTKSWDDTEEDSLKMQQFIDCNSRDHSMTGTPQSMDRIVSRSRSPDIISMKDIDDFAMEAIS